MSKYIRVWNPSYWEVQEEPHGRRPGCRTVKLLFNLVVLLAVLQVSASTACFCLGDSVKVFRCTSGGVQSCEVDM